MCKKQWLHSKKFKAESRAFVGFYEQFPDEFKVVQQHEITKKETIEKSESEMLFFSDYRHDFNWDEQSKKWKENGAGCDVGFPIKWDRNLCWLGIDPFSITDNKGNIEARKYKWTDFHVTGKVFLNVEHLKDINEEHRYYVGLAHGHNGCGVTKEQLKNWCTKMGKCQEATEKLVGTFVILSSNNVSTVDKVVYLTNRKLFQKNAINHIPEIANIYVYDLNSACSKKELWDDLNKLYKAMNQSNEENFSSKLFRESKSLSGSL